MKMNFRRGDKEELEIHLIVNEREFKIIQSGLNWKSDEMGTKDPDEEVIEKMIEQLNRVKLL